MGEIKIIYVKANELETGKLYQPILQAGCG